MAALPPQVHLVIEEGGLAHLMAKDGPIAKFVDARAADVLKAARENCPVDTGQLRDSLGMEQSAIGGMYEARVGVRADADSRNESPTANHMVALWQEYGTSMGTPATHFISQALSSARVV